MTAVDLDVDALRAAYPDAFGNPARRAAGWGVAGLAAAYLVGSLAYFEIWKLFGASERGWQLIGSFFVWQGMADWQYAQIYVGIAQTLAMAFLGTLIASVVSLVVGFLAARNTMTLGPLRQAVRRVLDVLRGIDQLVWALVFVRAVGLGPLAGVLAIAVSDTGSLSKLYSEAIDNVEARQVEGIRSTGAGPVKTVLYGYLPQVMPVFLSQSLYYFESAVRSATILGVVGAGGIGMVLIERFRAHLYDQAAFVVLNVLVCVAVIDWGSRRIREHFIGAACR